MTDRMVQISQRAVAFLTAGALNHLWTMWADDTSCCTVCCVPCIALKELLNNGQLDELYGVYMQACESGHDETWDADNKKVRRDWLEQVWSGPRECHELIETPVEGNGEA